MRTARILKQPVYEPGKPIEEVARDYGLQPDQICKLASNENPWGPSALAKKAAGEALEQLHLYPDGSGHLLISQLASHHSLQEDQFVLGNGSNEIIELLGHVFLEPGDEVVCGEFAFVVYKLVALLMGAKPVEVEMPFLVHNLSKMSEAITEKTKLVFCPAPTIRQVQQIQRQKFLNSSAHYPNILFSVLMKPMPNTSTNHRTYAP